MEGFGSALGDAIPTGRIADLSGGGSMVGSGRSEMAGCAG